MSRASRIVALLALAALLGGCGLREAESKRDPARFDISQGTAGGFKAPGWTPGDRESWERQMRTRVQNQNEHVRIGGGA